MNKLHSLALCALITPVITLGAGSVLAEQSTEQDIDRKQQNTKNEQAATQLASIIVAQGQSTPRTDQTESQTAADRQNSHNQSRQQNRLYITSLPNNGVQASNLIGAKVKNTGDEDVGSVDDLIIDKNGKVAAIVVGVGGFLGLGQKYVAIDWDQVTRASMSEKEEFLIDITRQDLYYAPKFQEQD